MTLSNFDWTDKDSVKWFILLPTGHEGPYALKTIVEMRDRKKISGDVKIWAEGLNEAHSLNDALKPKPVNNYIDDFLPPLPEDDVPPIPLQIERTIIEEVINEEVLRSRKIPTWGFISGSLALLLVFAFMSVVKNEETFDISRPSKMAVKLYERVLSENHFDGWEKKIFFREYLSDDHSKIWLVNSGFQTCNIEASFSSIKGKTISMTDEIVSFKSRGKLSQHLVEFSSFEYLKGHKLIPGLYEMDVRATHCEWDGIIPSVVNIFSSPDEEYVARTKVILFSKGPEEFHKVLDRLIKKKMDFTAKEQSQNEIFWMDLQQKLETLHAMTLQIEQHFLDFLETPPAAFPKNLKQMVDKYTRQYGAFLTAFITENEQYFKNLNPTAKGISKKRNYEFMVRLMTKKIGLESVKLIEQYQAVKTKPSPQNLKKFGEDTRKVFGLIKADVTQKIIQISEDRLK